MKKTKKRTIHTKRRIQKTAKQKRAKMMMMMMKIKKISMKIKMIKRVEVPKKGKEKEEINPMKSRNIKRI